MKTYDHIVIGAGSAGAAVEARLSEDPRRSVLLVEAGGTSRTVFHAAPAAYPNRFLGRADWAYETEPEPGCDNRRIYEPRAKVGGCSAIRAMVESAATRPTTTPGAWGLGPGGRGWDDLLADRSDLEAMIHAARIVREIAAAEPTR